MKGDLSLTKTNGRVIIDIRNKFLAFKNNLTFTNCMSKTNNVLIDHVECIDIVMPMYNFLEYSKNYRKTTGYFWNYYRDEPNNPPLNDDYPDPITNFASFKYKTNITGKTSNANQENSKTLSKEIKRLRKILKLLFR